MISAVIVARNEAHRIEDCIKRARPYVDEVLVIDQDSSDRTREIAAHMADKVYGDRCHGYAEPSRQMAADLATHDWIFIIDCDEVLEAPDTLLRDLVAHRQAGVNGFQFNRITTVDGQQIADEMKLRLFDRHYTALGATPHTDPLLREGGLGKVESSVAILHHDKTKSEQNWDDVRGERFVPQIEPGYLIR